MARLPIRSLAAITLAAAGLATGVPALLGQEPQSPAAPSIQSLSEPGEGLAIQARSPQTGLVTFASTRSQGVLLRGMAAAPAEERAMAFVDQYGTAFGLATRANVRALRAPQRDALGLEHVRLQQVADGIPVTAGDLIVHLRGDRVVAVNGHTLPDPMPVLIPDLTPGGAQEAARVLIEKHKADLAPGATYGEPRLEIFNRGMIDEGTHPTRLAWFVEATGEGLREYIWVDARTGGVLLNFSQLADAKSRTVYDVAMGTTLPGTLVRSEGGPATGIVDADQAYDLAGATYDYFFSTHGRDSYDDAGAGLMSSVRYRHPSQPGVPYQNAFWNGTQMVYGEGFAAADDVVAHELTHAVTEYSANLFYYYQSGALNESFSDIFGQTVDFVRGAGDDTGIARWRLAEDLSIGAIRDMMTPTTFGDPGKLSDPQFFCVSNGWTNPSGDSGGVHINSGVPNHAFALMVDGGTYNGRTITGIGLAKAGLIQYRALTTYLTSGSTFADNSTAVNQSCTDLVGTGGITAGDCSQVASAILAVEMASPWPCTGATPPPATFCPAGGAPVPAFSDGFESGGANWNVSTTSGTNWGLGNFFARSGDISAYGEDTSAIADRRIAMTNPVVIPAAGRMYFDHAFEFEHSGATTFYDGGVLEYSTNGTTWIDAGSLIDGGHAYAGTLDGGNVLGARSAFVRSSFGYTGTRLNLASLAGQSVRFRFRVGTDPSVGSLGWLVDNVSIYSCGGGPPPTTAQPPTGLFVSSVAGNVVTIRFTPPVAGLPPTGYELRGGIAPSRVDAALPIPGTSPIYTFVAPSGSFFIRVHTVSGASSSGPSNEVPLVVNVPLAPSAPANLLGLANGSSLTLAWRNTFGGGAPASHVLDVTGSIVTSLPIGPGNSFSFNGVPAGTYTLSLRATNAGGASPSSNSVTLTFPSACTGAPGTPENFLAYKVGNTVFVVWDPASTGPAPTGFVLNVTGSFVGSFGTPARAMSSPVAPGTYNVSVVASNPCGSSAATAVQSVTVP
ncbi:MAG: M4 family metallopeptidase [Acidobacteria bacterium]|nr:M4 family metallopeptidase [Acidobacteriota bacterium]